MCIPDEVQQYVEHLEDGLMIALALVRGLISELEAEGVVRRPRVVAAAIRQLASLESPTELWAPFDRAQTMGR